MIESRTRNLLLTILEELHRHLTNSGWAITEEHLSPPQLNETLLIEGYPDEKLPGNIVAVSYAEIDEPAPVELGNSKLVKQTRTLEISVVGMLEMIAQNLAFDCKEYFDKNTRIPYSVGEEAGQVSVKLTDAKRIYPLMPDEWRKYWWSVRVVLDEYFEL